ncbi:hypothetical protein D3C76_736660 [compost metagenome]
MLHWLVRGGCYAIQHRHPRRSQLGNTGLIQNCADTRHLTSWHLALSQVIDRQHGMGLAATEGCLQLNNRITALARQPLNYRI